MPKVSDTYNLAVLYPEIAESWHHEKNGNLSPFQIAPKSPKRVWWVCEKGHEWDALVYSRTASNRGCPVCSNQRVLKGFNDLATVKPEVASKWSINNKKLPTEVMPFTHQKFLWVGECGHEYEAMVSDVSNGRGCPFCAGRQIIVGFNDFASQFPEIAKEWHPIKNIKTPQEVAKASETKAWWICDKGHEYEAWINIRTHQNTACSYCVNRKVLKGYNDLEFINPELAAQLSPKNSLKPSEIMVTSDLIVIWACDKGHEWEQRVSVRHRKGYDCPECYSRTSKSEFLLREAMRAVLNNVNESHTQKLDIDGIPYRKQVDIFGELQDGRKIIVEYDGWYWHKDKLEKDTRESLAMLNNGYVVVRVRERSGSKVLNPIKINHPDFLSLSAELINAEDKARIIAKEIMEWAEC